ncbi:MAG: uracil-DNA glycosylase [Acidobacteria bacterium]|nr:uracil-DNA glycosylase [Acidobacteriota bacterium]
MEELKRQILESIHYYRQLGVTHVAARLQQPLTIVPKPKLEVVAAASPQTTHKAPSTSVSVNSVLSLVKKPAPLQDTAALVAGITGSDARETLSGLYAAFSNCRACALATTRHAFVFGEGAPDARLMFVGEGPGRQEDETGRPFVGDAGQLLTRIIEAMGLSRADVFIANVVKCRPPGNRAPLPDEMATCSPILKKQIETVKPEIVVALGGTALRFFKGEACSIVRSRGVVFDWHGTPIMPTFHPAYILRNPAAKREVWDDMQAVMGLLGLARGR